MIDQIAGAMDFKDFVSFYCDRANAVQTFWNFYVAVALGVLAFILTGEAGEGKKARATILSFGFVLFAALNATALWQAARQREFACKAVVATVTSLKSRPEYHLVQQLATYLQYSCPAASATLVTQIIADLMVLGLIWFVVRLESRSV